MCILDGKAYSALEESGRETDADDVETCIIATNNQVRESLRRFLLYFETVCKHVGSGEHMARHRQTLQVLKWDESLLVHSALDGPCG